MSNPHPTPPKGKAWQQGANKRARKRMSEAARRNREAFEGKKALLDTYESMDSEDYDYMRELKARLHSKRQQLTNRGMMVDT